MNWLVVVVVVVVLIGQFIAVIPTPSLIHIPVALQKKKEKDVLCFLCPFELLP